MIPADLVTILASNDLVQLRRSPYLTESVAQRGLPAQIWLIARNCRRQIKKILTPKRLCGQQRPISAFAHGLRKRFFFR